MRALRLMMVCWTLLGTAFYGCRLYAQAGGAAASTLGAPKPPTYLYAGQKDLTVITDPQSSVPSGDSIKVMSLVDSKGKCDDTATRLQLVASPNNVTGVAVQPSGINSLRLVEGLTKGTYVCFYRSVENASTPSPSQSALQPVLELVPPKFDPDPVAGVTSITVIATPTDAKNTGTAEIELYIIPAENGPTTNCDPQSDIPVLLSGNKLTATTDSQGIATLTLASALLEGSQVCAYQKFTTAAGAVVDIAQVSSSLNVALDRLLQATPVKYVYDTLDWGRVRAYFAGGVLIANDQSNFSSSAASPFLLFTLDKTWLMPGCSRLKPWNPKDNASVSGCGTSPGAPGINTFFQTRLTAIPVQTGTATSSTTTSSASSGGSLSSQKTARLEVGGYVPWILTHWYYNNQPNALFFGPLVRGGFDTLTGSTSQTVTSQSSSVNVNFSRFYDHYGTGVRIGHYALTHSDNKAPEILSYLDVVFGPYSNLQSYVCLPNKGNVLPGSGCRAGEFDSRTALYRLDMEGILKIPRTVVFIGFNANLKMQSRKNLDLSLQPNDDLRFLFGVKLDVASVMQKLGVSPSGK